MTDKFVQTGLIEAEELLPLLDQPQIKMVDASYVLPGQPDNRLDHFAESRIGNAVFFDIDQIADQNTNLPHMLPSAEDFAHAVSGLGISNDDLVVIYGQSGIVMGPCRAWWSFRVFGHDKVCVLNGGLPAWRAAGMPMNDDPYAPPRPGDFKAHLQKDLVVDLAGVQRASESDSALIFDARPPARFDGMEPEPRAGLAMGHIPGSTNIPTGCLIEESTGKLKSQADLDHLFESYDLNNASALITTCGSGVTAAVVAFALYHLGSKQASVYDGSWAEWGAQDLPVVSKTPQN